MRFSIPRLRGVLIAGAALLVLVLVAYIGLGRYRSLMVYQRLLKRSGVTLTHDTNGFTYSQSLLGRTVFTLHAAKATQLGSGKWALHEADLTLFDRAGNPADHITGSEIDYDEATGVARAQGVVDMELQPPQGLANGGRAVTSAGTPADALAAAAATPKTAQAVHVRTSGLVYNRKLGIATTDQKVEFRYGGMDCTAMGAEFNSQASTLRLLAQVAMEGVAHGQPLHVRAASAEMNRDDNVAVLMKPVVSSNGQSAAADKGLLNLRKDGSIERLQGIDHVVLRSETEVVTAARLDATLNSQDAAGEGAAFGRRGDDWHGSSAADAGLGVDGGCGLRCAWGADDGDGDGWGEVLGGRQESGCTWIEPVDGGIDDCGAVCAGWRQVVGAVERGPCGGWRARHGRLDCRGEGGGCCDGAEDYAGERG